MMPKKISELSALEVRRRVAPGMHFVGGVPGLALQVLPTGGRTWILRVVIAGRRRDMGLGGFPEVGLAQARAKAAELRELIRAGRNPLAEVQAARSALRAAVQKSMTFRQAAERFIEDHRPSWSNPKHAAQWENTLVQYAYKTVGELDVKDVSVAHILKILEQPVGDEGKLWEVRTETASRLRGRMEKVLDWAKGRGMRSGDNPAAWRGNLEAMLPKATKLQKIEHHPAVSLDQLGSFMIELSKRDGIAARALAFVILTAARSGEVRGMTWSEVDEPSGTWVIPAERMKARKEHRIPLPTAARDLLENLPRIEGSDFVFSAPRGGKLSDMALTAVMRRMNRTEVPHGFRSTFRDWAAERTNYPRDLAEMALAHAIGNAVEAAYRRGDMLQKRREMMESWAQFAGRVMPLDGTVIGINERRVL
jgi:integrase